MPNNIKVRRYSRNSQLISDILLRTVPLGSVTNVSLPSTVELFDVSVDTNVANAVEDVDGVLSEAGYAFISEDSGVPLSEAAQSVIPQRPMCFVFSKDLKNDDPSYSIESYLLWPGTSKITTPSNVKFSAKIKHNDDINSSFRLVTSSGLVVGEFTAISSTSFVIYDLGVLSNWPSSEDLLSLQLKSATGKKDVKLQALTIYF